MAESKMGIRCSVPTTCVHLLPAEGHWTSGKEIIVDAAKAHNCLALINDAQGFPGEGKKANLVSFQLMDRATSDFYDHAPCEEGRGAAAGL
jgi:hypothetical protein